MKTIASLNRTVLEYGGTVANLDEQMLMYMVTEEDVDSNGKLLDGTMSNLILNFYGLTSGTNEANDALSYFNLLL